MKDEPWRLRIEAPLRVDFGGTIDIPEVAGALAGQRPCTFNIAIEPGIALEVGRCPVDGNVVSGPRGDVMLPKGLVPPRASAYRLVFGTLAALGCSGVHVRILPGARPGSGLGGSGAVTCSLVLGLTALRGNETNLDDALRLRCAILAREIEVGLGESITGLQDQLAAAFGGINLWEWQWDAADGPVIRKPLAPCPGLQEHLLVCELPCSRASSAATSEFLRSLQVLKLQRVWAQLNALTASFADCVVARDWQEGRRLSHAALTMRQVLLQRDDLLSHPVIEQALGLGCAAGFGGGNVDGSLWVIGPASAIQRIRADIGHSAASGIRVLPTMPAEHGAQISWVQ